jgi:raffinose/stachyose/melibiose transport system permease protein
VPPPGEPRRVAYLYLLPAGSVYAGFVLLPLVHSLLLSFYRWDGITAGTWVGLQNYRDLLADPGIRSAFSHSLVLIAFYSLLPAAIGLLLAASVSRMRVKGLAAYRTVLFLPQVIPMVVVAVVWRTIYAPQSGSLNQALRAVGLDSLARAWLGDFTWALPAVGLVGTWVQFGLCMVLFIAGVQKIPTSLYDAAKVDGAGPLREFFAVTLPGLRNELAVALTLTIIAALRNFDLVYVTTRGGPGNATSVPAFEVYNRAFLTGEVGSASAIGIALTVIIFAITFAVSRIEERRR